MSGIIARLARVPLGPIAAVVLGLATGFAAWAIPASLLGAALRRLHMIDLLPAAAPPYAETTRVALAVLGGVVLGVAVLLLFRRLEGGPRPMSVALEGEGQRPPVLRRGDRHPDAPARRPLFATELLLEHPVTFDDEPKLASAESVPGNVAAAAAWSELDEVAEDEGSSSLLAEDEAPQPIAPLPVVEPMAVTSPAPTVTPTPRDDTVADLLARLETGLARRSAPSASPTTPRPDSAPFGDQLRDALADLQRMARR